MKKKTIYSLLVIFSMTLMESIALATKDSMELELIRKARAIHERITTIDTHVDIPVNFATSEYDPMLAGVRGQQVHIPTMIQGGLDATFLIVFVRQGERNKHGYANALATAFQKFSAIHRLTKEMHPDKIELALTSDDVKRINNTGKKIALIGVENGYPIGRNIELLDTFYDFGARYFGIVHNGHNDLGDSAMPRSRINEPSHEHNGLSDFGLLVVKRLNKLGIIVDISHASKQTSLDIIETSKAPVMASHSGVDGVLEHPRNLSDEELLALKDNNGVVQIVAFDSYLRFFPQEKRKKINILLSELGIKSILELKTLSDQNLKIYDEEMAKIELQYPRAGVRDLVSHIKYAVSKIGINHVGIASDFNGGGGIAGWSDASETFNVTLELVKHGFNEEEISKLWGGNLLRVMSDVQDFAKNKLK